MICLFIDKNKLLSPLFLRDSQFTALSLLTNTVAQNCTDNHTLITHGFIVMIQCGRSPLLLCRGWMFLQGKKNRCKYTWITTRYYMCRFSVTGAASVPVISFTPLSLSHDHQYSRIPAFFAQDKEHCKSSMASIKAEAVVSFTTGNAFLLDTEFDRHMWRPELQKSPPAQTLNQTCMKVDLFFFSIGFIRSHFSLIWCKWASRWNM